MLFITHILRCKTHYSKCVKYINCNLRTFTSFRKPYLTCLPSVPRGVTFRRFGQRFSKHGKLEFEVNTDVSKDILLFKCAKPRMNYLILLFGVSQGVFWVYMSNFVYTVLTPNKFKNKSSEELQDFKTIFKKQRKVERITLWEDIGMLSDGKFRMAFTAVCAAIGSALLTCSVVLSLRSVQYVILKKGGQSVRLITSSPWLKLRSIDVPLQNVTCTNARQSCKNYHSVKVHGYLFKFLLDQTGTYLHPKLYDHTIGVKRYF